MLGIWQERPAALPSLKVAIPLYIGAIGLAEVVTALLGVAPGLICHAVILVTLLNHYIVTGPAPCRKALQALALAPLLRICSLTMPFGTAPRLSWYVLVGLPVLVSLVMMGGLRRIACDDTGSRQRWRAQGSIALAGLPLGIVAYLILRPRPIIAALDVPHVVVASLIIAVFGGCLEEFVFRGLLQRALVDVFGSAGVAWGAVLFACMYIGTLSPAYVLFSGLVGLFFGWCVHRTGSLWGVGLAHGALLVGMSCIWPFVLR